MLLDLILKESMGKESGSFEKAVYSDLGFMLLGIIIEKVMNTDLNEAAKNLVFDPLCVEDIFFIPEKGHLTSTFSRQKLIKNTAPTLYCPYRKRIIMGEVHDLNAWAMGGLAGHSGLFGTGKAVCKLLKKFLLIFKGRFEHPVFKRDLMREFFIKQEMDPASTWALGFDTPSPEGSSSGDHFSPESVGHLGYTGTSFWMDPREEMIVVFLSNRTFPHDTEKSRLAIKDLRRKLHNLIMEKRNLTCC